MMTDNKWRLRGYCSRVSSITSIFRDQNGFINFWYIRVSHPPSFSRRAPSVVVGLGCGFSWCIQCGDQHQAYVCGRLQQPGQCLQGQQQLSNPLLLGSSFYQRRCERARSSWNYICLRARLSIVFVPVVVKFKIWLVWYFPTCELPSLRCLYLSCSSCTCLKVEQPV